jgi:serine/threonine-protein kinase
MVVLAFLAVACSLIGILYAGAFSAACLAVALGLYFFCRTEHLSSAIAIYVFAAGGHAIEVLLVVTGVIDDPGFYPINSDASFSAQIAGQLNLQFAYALVFWLARITRQSSLRAIEQLQKATRLAAQRDVQVAELRRDLAKVLEVGAPGRFTEHVFGSWKLGNVIGRGSMGEVYEAVNPAGDEAAVKLIRRELLSDPKQLERFFRETRIASAIQSPHVVKVIEAAPSTDALPYLVMEKLAGHTLSELLRKGPIGKDELAALVAQICRVLDLAREAGIVHRDIKPQNLFRCTDGTWKLLDFGIAQQGDGSGTLTRGGVIGTPVYMAPEQAKGEPVDHRADVYALGAVLYRCVTGRAPFSAADSAAVLYAVAHEKPLRPSAIAKVSPAVDRVLALALAKARADRFATTTEFGLAFARALRNEPDHLADLANAWSEPDRDGI